MTTTAISQLTGWAYRVSAPYSFERVEESVSTTVPDGQLLVELTAGAVCGSDLPVARGAMVPPGGAGQVGRPMHEVVGRVVTSAHPDFATGDTVVGWAAKEDALRQYFVTTGDRVDVARMGCDDVKSTVAQSVACLMTAFNRLGPLRGRSVGIVGMGPFGIMAASMARTLGAGRIVGVDPLDRSDDVWPGSVDELVMATGRAWSEDLAEADRLDIVLEMVGHQTSTLVDAMRAVAKSGTVLSFGVPDDDWYALPLRDFFRHNGTLITGVTVEHRDVLRQAQDYLIASPWLAEHIVTHVHGLDGLPTAFHQALAPTPGQRKVVIDVTR